MSPKMKPRVPYSVLRTVALLEEQEAKNNFHYLFMMPMIRNLDVKHLERRGSS